MSAVTDEMKKTVSENVKRAVYSVNEAIAKYRPEKPCRIMAVTKTVEPALVNAAVEEGITLLGENRVQEYLSKKDLYDKRAEVHFIGRLQKNKVKYIIPDIGFIHSADSFPLCEKIASLAGKHGITANVLAEVNIGGEESKGGISPDDIFSFARRIGEMNNIRLRGLMAIPPRDKSEECFEKMRELSEKLRSEIKDADMLSMGMSADYILAVKYGADIVRLGTALFGARFGTV